MKLSMNEHEIQVFRAAALLNTDTGVNEGSPFIWTDLVSSIKIEK